MKHLSIIELGNNENPSIGVIMSVEETFNGLLDFRKRLGNALNSHFDADCTFGSVEAVMEELSNYSPYCDIEVNADDAVFSVRIMETWIY